MDKFKHLTWAEKTKTISETWSQLKDEQKYVYLTKASQDKLRYEREMNELGAQGWYKNKDGKDSRDFYKVPSPRAKNIDKRSNGDKEANETSNKKKGSKAEKDDVVRPKKPLTAFIFFSLENWSKVLKKNPDIKPTEILKQNGEDWKSLSETLKKNYEGMVEKDKVRFEKEKT